MAFTDKQLEDYKYFQIRKQQLKESRAANFGYNIENIWREADESYQPGRTLKSKKKLVENERTEKSSYAKLQKDAWRNKEPLNTLFKKVQTAMTVLIDSNPEGVFEPKQKKYQWNTKFISSLYHQTWLDPILHSKQELKKFIFNLSKYGFAVGRRYHKYQMREKNIIIDEKTMKTKKREIPGNI